jgi:type II secretory pathway component GspD/PulD (secretin)
VADVRVLHLRYGDALNVAQAINQLFGQARTSSGSQQNVTPIFMRQGNALPATDSQENPAGTTLQVAAAAVSRTNTVVATGPNGVLDVVEEMVKKLDARIPNLADVKVFHLQYAGAPNTATVINQVFETGRTTSQSSSGTP